MEQEFLAKLSNADAIAGNESEVRQLIRKRLEDLDLVERTDGLGSLIYSRLEEKAHYDVMLCAHMDEVGFMVRTIDELGMLHLMKVGGVQVYGQSYQAARVTTQTGNKIPGMLVAQYQSGELQRVFCDIGATTKKEVVDLGIQIGDMVTFDTTFTSYATSSIYAGKAMDNRLACYILCELAERLKSKKLGFNLHLAFTSSEEVGIRGARTSAYLINPDIAFVIDVATAPNQLVRDHTNQRQVGKGPMMTLFDRTLSPNRKMVNYVRDIANDAAIPLQLDMFNTGGTDGGETHKVYEGKPTLVTIVPVRYGHCSASLVSSKDVDLMTDLYQQLLEQLTDEKIQDFKQF